MQQLELLIHNATGLHARPARVFVDLAKQYESSIHIRHGEKRVNAKSLIAVLTLGVGHGQQIIVDISGVDEQLAALSLAEAVRAGLGEDLADGHAIALPQETDLHNITSPFDGDGRIIRGVPGAPGFAIGPIYRFERASVEVGEHFGSVDQEHARLHAALEAAHQQIVTLREQVLQRSTAAEAGIFEVHRELLADPELLEVAHAAIADGLGAAAAWQGAIEQQATQMAQVSNQVQAERAADIRDVGARVLRLLSSAEPATPQLPEHPVIVVAYDLTPSETAAFDPARVLGFCTAIGGPNAHTAILARALGLPAVVSAGPSVLELTPGSQAILDGGAGSLLIAPDARAIQGAQAAQRRERARAADARQAARELAITRDGHRVEVAANIGGLADARQAAETGAEGVGLLRTEFLFLDRATAPTEDEQFAIYQDILQALGSAPVIARTLDIGGDKPLPYLDLPAEDNPFLGERGIRLCLTHPNLFETQLRALLRAATFGRLRIMFPMIADIAELRRVREIIDRLRSELGVPPVEIGIMIEVPAAALMADMLAHEVDFFSIGTNDLTQYTLAIDRGHPTLAAQADGLHPAVLRLIARTAEAAHAAGKWAGVCGELGADPLAVPILIGLGVDELSVSVPAIPAVKAQVRSLALAECQELARRALACATAAQVREGARSQ